jgi:aminoglycoside phosphotransferase (APT) family kinase protein
MSWERFATGQMLALAVRRFGRDFPPELSQLGDLCTRRRDGLESLWARGARTLVHGDCHIGNLFFAERGVGFFDWQVCARAPGVRDVSYFLCNSFPSDLRVAHERDLIALYLEQLADRGIVAPSFEEAWTQHRLFAVYTWLAAAFTAAAGEGLQAREIGMAGLRRTTRAATELESIALIERELA